MRVKIIMRNLFERLQYLGVKCLASDNQLHLSIEYINVQEFPLKSERIKPRGLILSTWSSFKNNIVIKEHLLWLKSVDINAVGISTLVINKIPREIIDFCEKEKIILLEIPAEVPYSDIFTTYNQLAVEKSTSVREKIEDINLKMLHAVADGEGPETIISMVSNEFSSLVIYLANDFRIRTYAGPIKYFKEEILKISQKVKIYEDILYEIKDIQLELRDKRIEVTVHPIIDNGEVISYFLVENAREFTLFEHSILTHCKTALLLDTLKRQSIWKHVQLEDIDQIKSILLNKSIESIELSNTNLTKKELSILESLDKSPNIVEIKRLVVEQDPEGLVFIFRNNLIIFTRFSICNNRKLQQFIFKNNYFIGISGQSTITDIKSLFMKYEEARVSLMISKYKKDNIYQWNTDFTTQIFATQFKFNESIPKSTHQLEKLIIYDNNNETQLTKTLMTYVEEMCNVKNTAKKLYLHRNTVSNRLEKIMEILNINEINNYFQFINLANSLEYIKMSEYVHSAHIDS